MQILSCTGVPNAGRWLRRSRRLSGRQMVKAGLVLITERSAPDFPNHNPQPCPEYDAGEREDNEHGSLRSIKRAYLSEGAPKRASKISRLENYSLAGTAGGDACTDSSKNEVVFANLGPFLKRPRDCAAAKTSASVRTKRWFGQGRLQGDIERAPAEPEPASDLSGASELAPSPSSSPA